MNFRFWIQQIWYEHLAEVEAWGIPNPTYNVTEYFQKYRWWLRREWRHQQSIGQL